MTPVIIAGSLAFSSSLEVDLDAFVEKHQRHVLLAAEMRAVGGALRSHRSRSEVAGRMPLGPVREQAFEELARQSKWIESENERLGKVGEQLKNTTILRVRKPFKKRN